MDNKFNKILLSKRTKYLVLSMDNFSTENDFLNDAADKMNNGFDIVEFRQNNLTSDDFLNLALKLRELTAVFNTLLIIYDRIDIAKLISADGIVLDKNTFSVEQAQKLIKKTMLIGVHLDNNNMYDFSNNIIDFTVSKSDDNGSFDIKNFVFHQQNF